MPNDKFQGLMAATYTPFDDQGSLNLAAVPPMVEHLVTAGVKGLYVCGSTGEGMSLSQRQRVEVTEAYQAAAQGRLPVMVQVGHNCLAEARELAAEAEKLKVHAISATCPSYFKITDARQLVESMAEVASGAPSIPFYYYHIPSLTGSRIDMVEFMTLASERIPNLVGLKYTDTQLHEYQSCLELDNRFDILWGCDEMLLGALATGCQGAIGSTYNIATPIYSKVIENFQVGNLEEARRYQSVAIKMIRIMAQYPFHSAMKAALRHLGLSVGRCQLPQANMAPASEQQLIHELNAIGFPDWDSI